MRSSGTMESHMISKKIAIALTLALGHGKVFGVLSEERESCKRFARQAWTVSELCWHLATRVRGGVAAAAEVGGGHRKIASQGADCAAPAAELEVAATVGHHAFQLAPNQGPTHRRLQPLWNTSSILKQV